MWALGATAVCGVLAATWSVVHLRAVFNAAHHDPARLGQALRRGASASELASVVRDDGSMEAELMAAIDGAPSAAAARRLANESLLDLEATLPSPSPVRATCVRIGLLGTVLGVALLVARGQATSLALVDVLAVGGAAILVAWTCGAEVERFVERRRKEIDELVDGLMRSKWGAAWAADQEQSARAVQPREPGAHRGVDDDVRR